MQVVDKKAERGAKPDMCYVLMRCFHERLEISRVGKSSTVTMEEERKRRKKWTVGTFAKGTHSISGIVSATMMIDINDRSESPSENIVADIQSRHWTLFPCVRASRKERSSEGPALSKEAANLDRQELYALLSISKDYTKPGRPCSFVGLLWLVSDSSLSCFMRALLSRP